MSTFAIILIIISACMHASWNFLSKKQHPTTGFFVVSQWVSVLLALPVLIYYASYLPQLDGSFYGMLCLSSIFQTLYLCSLAAAYRHGDMSLAYPLARSAPLIVVSVSAILLGRGD